MGPYDVVSLKIDIPKDSLKEGDEGTIVEILAPDVFMVEFADGDGVTLALPTVKSEHLDVVWSDTTK